MMNKFSPYLYVGNICTSSFTQIASEALTELGAVAKGAGHTLAPVPFTNLHTPQTQFLVSTIVGTLIMHVHMFGILAADAQQRLVVVSAAAAAAAGAGAGVAAAAVAGACLPSL
jgi:hypothetical protein